MKILFVTKRHPQQRDLMERPYGRFHHLPVQLALLGHEVRVLLCSHRSMPTLQMDFDGVRWSSHDIKTLGAAGLWRNLKQEAENFHADWVVAFSDTYYGWIARRLARASGARLAIDAYDNYEAYMTWNLPLHALWRRSIAAADLVTAAGPQLAERLQSHRRSGHQVEVIPMAADPEFKPLDKLTCRRNLGLPMEAPLIGYTGSWGKARGTAMLIDAFRQARTIQPNLHLVLSGKPPAEALGEPGVIGTGYLDDAKLPELINALDVACVITADTAFGRYSYPAKLCEAMACGVPIVATATKPVRWMLGNQSEHLVPPDDAHVFALRIVALLAAPRRNYGVRITWEMQAKRVNFLLKSLGHRDF